MVILVIAISLFAAFTLCMLIAPLIGRYMDFLEKTAYKLWKRK